MGQLDDDIMQGKEPDDEDHVVCNRCGRAGLYWQERWQANGSSKHMLIDSVNDKPHVCQIKDAFSAVPE